MAAKAKKTVKPRRPTRTKGLLARGPGIRLPLYEHERQQITRDALLAGVSASHYVRERALQHPVPDNSAAVMAGELSDIGRRLKAIDAAATPEGRRVLARLTTVLEGMA